MRVDKFDIEKKPTELIVPDPMSLLEIINSRLEFSNIRQKITVNLARRLSHLQIFFKSTTQKHNVNVKLAKRPLETMRG